MSEASQLPKATAKQYDKIIFGQKRIGIGDAGGSGGISAIPTPHGHIAPHDLPHAILHLLQDQPCRPPTTGLALGRTQLPTPIGRRYLLRSDGYWRLGIGYG